VSRLGTHNSVTDVEGILVGHYTDEEAASGVTVVRCQEGAVGGVDVRGAAPGTRETDLLDPTNLVEEVQAVVLSGGSVYGLAAADGVVRWLAERGKGFPLEGTGVAPIVPAAILYDLGRGKTFRPPIGPDWGYAACESARSGSVQMGCVGAGTGAVSGGIKGGIGTASEVLASGLTVGAIVAVNSFGSTIDPASGRPWEVGSEIEGEFGALGQRAVRLPQPTPPEPARNTTIGVVATDALLTKAQAQKLAQLGHDGLARAIRPAHTLFDGDTIFCLATGSVEIPDVPEYPAAPKAPVLADLGRAAADTFARAIVHAILSAKSLQGYQGFQDLPESFTVDR
jgi:L-aminopeptidase/D-esterase-like protein